MTVRGPVVTLQVKDDDKVLEPYRPARRPANRQHI